MKKWSTPEQLTDLLCELVRVPSINGSEAERAFPAWLSAQLSELSYFKAFPEHLQVHPTEDGRSFVTALVKSGKPTARTAVLLSHFDVVETECYSELQAHAFDVRTLTRLIRERKDELPDEAKADVEKGEWLFGRGVMDMKSGLALHMSMIERASEGEFEGNVLLLAVPDEEVGSIGMRSAVPALVRMAEERGLEYALVMNSEPMHLPEGDDASRYLEMGSTGKVLPSFLCFGMEAHVMEPFRGLNGNYMASELARELELNDAFSERAEGHRTSPPTNLVQRSLMKGYSVTLPYRTVAMFNLFMLETTVDRLMEPLLQAARRAAAEIENGFAKRAQDHFGPSPAVPEYRVRVLAYEELLGLAVREFGETRVGRAIDAALRELPAEADDREAAAAAVDAVALLCRKLAPMIVLFFAPPFYPPASSGRNPFVAGLAVEMSRFAKERYGIELKPSPYHGAMIDLSYVGMPEGTGSNRKLADNMPLWGSRYWIPFEAMERFRVPVMNFGPFGKDPHKWTERLECDYSFRILPDLMSACIAKALSDSNDRSSAYIVS